MLSVQEQPAALQPGVLIEGLPIAALESAANTGLTFSSVICLRTFHGHLA